MAIAQAAGLRTPIAQGLMQVCYVAELLTDFFDAAFFTTGWLRSKFLNPLFPGDAVTVRACVLSVTKADGSLRRRWGTPPGIRQRC